MRTLMLHVDGIVRPLFASESRKLRMREELLAHLATVAEEAEGEGLAGEEAARAAIDRFGEPEEVRAELQASVPAIERVLFIRLPAFGRLEQWTRPRFMRREGEPLLGWAARGAQLLWLCGMMGMPAGIAFAWIGGALGFMHPNLIQLHKTGLFAMIAAVVLYPALFAFLTTAGAMAATLEHRDDRGAGLRVGLMALLLDLVILAVLMLARLIWTPGHQVWGGPYFAKQAASLLLAAPALCIFAGSALAVENRRERFWRGLDPDEIELPTREPSQSE